MLSAAMLAFALVAQLEAAPSDELTGQVRRLVRQLDAAELGARNQAEEELLKLGPAALELLPADQAGSAELQQRLGRIRQTLEKQAAEQMARGSTLSLSGMLTLEDVRAAIEKQTGNKIVDYREKFGQNVTNPRFKLEIANAPFWQALDAVLDSTKMTVYQYSGKDGLALIDRPEEELPRGTRAAYAGPLRLEATRIIAERHPGKTKPGSLRVILEVGWEPRLSPITFVQPMAQLAAVDDQGQKLNVDVEQATLEAPVQGGGTGVELPISFAPPPRSAKSIASLKGTLTALVPGKVEAFEFGKLVDATKPQFKPLEQKKTAATVTLDQIRKNNEVWEVLVRVRFDEVADALESHRGWILQNEVYLVGPDKNRVENAGFHTTLRTENEMGMAYQFDLPDGVEGFTLVYKSPSSVHVLPVQYELKNLPLP